MTSFKRLYYVYRWTAAERSAYFDSLGPSGESKPHAARGHVVQKDLTGSDAQDVVNASRVVNDGWQYEYTLQDERVRFD